MILYAEVGEIREVNESVCIPHAMVMWMLWGLRKHLNQNKSLGRKYTMVHGGTSLSGTNIWSPSGLAGNFKQVLRGQEVLLIFLCLGVYLELISISCVYAISAGGW